MSAPRVIAELVVTGIRVLGKATAAAGAQAVRNFKHKPEGAASSSSAGTGPSSKSAITSQMNMSLEEARLILNVKKEDPMEVIQKSYDRIFAANGPPPEPVPKPSSSSSSSAPSSTSSSSGSGSGSGSVSARKSRAPTHSHYLQSKVFRALERIRAEQAAEEVGVGAGGEGGEARGAAAGAAEGAGSGGAAAGGDALGSGFGTNPPGAGGSGSSGSSGSGSGSGSGGGAAP